MADGNVRPAETHPSERPIDPSGGEELTSQRALVPFGSFVTIATVHLLRTYPMSVVKWSMLTSSMPGIAALFSWLIQRKKWNRGKPFALIDCTTTYDLLDFV